MNTLSPFLTAVQRRLNRRRAVTLGLKVFGISAGLVLLVAAGFLLRGEEVPAWAFFSALGITPLAWGLLLWRGRCTVAEATAFADRFFDLDDAVTSARRFQSEGQEDGFYALQRARTENLLEDVQPESIRMAVPRRLAVVALVLIAGAVSTAFVPSSPEVIERRQREREVLAKSEEVNEGLEEAIDSLEREMVDPLERELLNAEELRDWVKELRQTKDIKEAMRQYAALERRVAQSSSRLEQRRDEQLLSRAGEELLKEDEHRQLGEQLKTQKYKDAAKKLKEMQLRAKEKENDPKEMAAKKRRLKKLKSAAKRMASAARGSSGALGNQPETEISDELRELLERLEELADQLGLEMDGLEFEGEMGSLSELSAEQLKDLLEQMEKLDQNMESLNLRLRRMDAKKNLQGKLKLLGLKLSKAQGYCAGNLQSPFAVPGGLQPGEGTSEERRKERDALVDNGQFSQLNGLKGRGPSQTQIEEASEGGGISRLQAEDVERDFARQLEAFVQREDVPEDVKDGVRDYFTNIHQQESTDAGVGAGAFESGSEQGTEE